MKTNSRSFFSYVAGMFFIALCLLSGCSSAPKHDPEFAPSMPVENYHQPQEEEIATGGIYKTGQEIILYEDLKARRIGDTITIRLAEKTNATKSADTDHSRSQKTEVQNPTLYGSTPEFNTPGFVPLSSNNVNSLEAQLESSHSFAGSGKSSQSNSLTGDITVTVADVLPNGNLVVRGEKRFNFNQGNEYVKIAGIVRPYDIGPDNTVQSTSLADATIIYNGDRAIADDTRVGWLARFFIGVMSPF
jgi:flagellar L-ring protein precursor FlgH